MKEWSKDWKSSKKPNKQRKYRYNAPYHIRKDFVSSMLSENLKTKVGTSSIPVRKGDKIEVMRGEYKNFSGEVTKVDYKKSKIYVDGIEREKVDGSEVKVPIEPSNVKLVKLNLDDERRISKYEVEEEEKEEIMVKKSEEEPQEDEESTKEEETPEEEDNDPEKVEKKTESNYEDLVDKNIGEIKNKIKEIEGKMSPEEYEKAIKKILKDEKNNKNRKTLVSYLEKKVE